MMFYFQYPDLIPWKRAGRNRFNYYDAQTREKKLLANQIIQKANNLNIKNSYDGELGFCCIFTKKFPLNTSKTKKKNLLFCSKKPDIDNLSKFLLDCLEKDAKLITNDSRIVMNLSIKIWGDYDNTAFILGKWDNSTILHQSNHSLGFNGIIYNFIDKCFVL